MLSLVLQLISGDSSARLISKYQPAKLAALEGVYKTVPATPISVIGWVDSKKEKVHSLKIPGALSLMTHRDLATPVTGLDKIPRDEWPNVPLTFQTYHIMVTMWALMFLIALLGFYYWGRKTLEKKKWLLWAMIFSVLLPHIAQQCGWICAEVGRQPWIVYKVLRTSEGVSTSISSSQVFGSITMFVIIYLLLFVLFLFLLDRKIKHGPEEIRSKADDLIYRDVMKGRF
jgi:cytochrome d ubiquinol oxidase subunit I